LKVPPSFWTHSVIARPCNKGSWRTGPACSRFPDIPEKVPDNGGIQLSSVDSILQALSEESIAE